MKKLLAATAAIVLLTACREQAPDANQASANAAEAASNVQSNAATPAAPVDAETAKRIMHDRHEGMEDIGDAMKAAGKEMKASAPDVEVLKKSAATIAGLAPKVQDWFPAGTGPDVGKTEALPAIWEKPDEFATRVRDFQAAAPAFHAAAQTGDMKQIGPAMGGLGKTCKGCHDTFRKEENEKH